MENVIVLYKFYNNFKNCTRNIFQPFFVLQLLNENSKNIIISIYKKK